MSCIYFKRMYDIGVCNASSDTHIPGIEEMGRHCFKDDYNACSIFRKCFAEIDLLHSGVHNVHSSHPLQPACEFNAGLL
jgi:hypothetical protein